MANIIEITDFNDSALDFYARMNESQLKNFRPNLGFFIAESPKVVERALDAGYKPHSILLEEKHIEGEGKDILKRCPDVPVYTGSKELLANLTGFQLTRGMLCLMERPVKKDFHDICKTARRIAILENVVNPTNVGAIFRSAAALNMDAVLLTKASCDPLYRRSIRVSMGTVFQIPWAYIGNNESDWPTNCLKDLKEMGFATASMALSNQSVSIDNEQLMNEEKLAIILGTEGDGLCEKTIASCDYTVKIPMANHVDSLNVAAASAVAFWQLGNRQ